MQGSSDPADLDDGPYEAGGEKEQDPRLIPVPANSYFGRDPSLVQNHSNSLLLSFSSLSPCSRPSVSGFLVLLTFFLSFPSCLLAFLSVSRSLL